jgi:HD superfamily phosphodiesterase
MLLLSKLLQFVLFTSQKFNIDESHGIGHSMDVLHFAHNIYESEVHTNPFLKKHENIIYVSAIIHDMCDKKYMNQDDGIFEIEKFLQKKLPTDHIDAVKQIISTMSYSYVQKNGFPILGEYQHAYHIVREADLLSAYDFDRCMAYKLHLNGGDIDDAFEDSLDLFNNRVLQHNKDNLFLTDYSLLKSRELHMQSLQRIQNWKQILKKPHL